MDADDPHGDQPVLSAGPDPQSARLSVILVHGRGATAEGMLGLASDLDLSDVGYLALQAADSTWYPYSFLAPVKQNEPGLSSALNAIARLVGSLRQQQMPFERIALLGFSQGACLALEYAARHPARYAAVIGLSGGLIGPPGTPRDYSGTFEDTPVLLGCSDVDSHIPIDRVRESADVFRRMRASVDARIYPRMGHTINGDEIDAARALLGPRGARP